VKRKAISPNPQRDEQFCNIKELTTEAIAGGTPVVSIDGKKKEFLGSLYREGKLWVPKGEELVRWDHDFPFLADGKVCPFGVYDLAKNSGVMMVGTGAETARFVVDCLRKWWALRGRHDYPDAWELLVLADCGGGCSYRCHMLKEQLQKFSDDSGLIIHMAHFPPGCSKWNHIEHKLFPHVTRAMAGTVFESAEQVAELMARAQTKTGLEVRGYVQPGEYPTGEKVSASYHENPPAIHDQELSNFNYSFVPEELREEVEPLILIS
jgi:hypothetical protein